MKQPLVCAALGLLLFCGATQASLIGQTVNFQRLGLAIDRPQGDSANGNYRVGTGVEVPDAFQNRVALDLGDRQLVFSFGDVRFSAVPFIGVRISDVFASIDAFDDLTVNDASTLDFSSGRLSFDADHLWINFANLAFRTGDRLVLDIGFNSSPAPVPEPGSAALMGLGLGLGLAVLAIRARRQRAADPR